MDHHWGRGDDARFAGEFDRGSCFRAGLQPERGGSERAGLAVKALWTVWRFPCTVALLIMFVIFVLFVTGLR